MRLAALVSFVDSSVVRFTSGDDVTLSTLVRLLFRVPTVGALVLLDFAIVAVFVSEVNRECTVILRRRQTTAR